MVTDMGAVLDEYRETRARVERLQAAAGSLRVSVRSPDRSVTVTVDVAGELRELHIDPAVAARVGLSAVTDGILSASRLAAAQARERLRVAVRDALPERLHHLVAVDGSVDLAALLPPEVPYRPSIPAQPPEMPYRPSTPTQPPEMGARHA